MGGFSWNLGPSDWLKMTNPTKPTQPITQMGTMSNVGSVAPAIGAATGAAGAKPAAQPIGQSAVSGASAGATASNPFIITDPAFNIAPPAVTPQPVMTPDQTAAAAAAGAGKAAAGASTAASQAGQTQQQAQGATMSTAADNAAINYSRPQPVAQTVQEPAAAAAAPQNMTPAPVSAPKTVQEPAAAAAAAPQNMTTAPISAPKEDTAAAQPVAATAPVKTEPSLDDNLANYEKIAADWANGVVDDKVFRTTANRAILQMGLNNQAETDALQMRINQDPALKGQGAGAALLSIMAANHNFSADQMFGQLAQDAQQKILDMQKYGLQQGVAINQMRRENDYKKLGMLQDAGDFSGAATLAAKIADFPGVSIAPSSFTAARSRLAEDAQNLLTAGNYNGAAAKLSALTGQTVDAATLQSRDPETWKNAQRMEDKGDFEGASKLYAANGLNISADDLRAMNPFQQTTWTNTLDGIKAQALTNPAGAEAQLNLLMQNPAAAKYLGFQAGTSAHDLIQSIVTGEYQANQEMRAGLQSEINLKAKSNVGFSQALVDYKAMGPAAWQGFTQDGQKLASSDLEKFNTARQALGMSMVHKDAQGNVVDANGHALMPDDFAETAAAADYTSRQAAIKQQPWQVAYENLMTPGSPMREKILAIPGGEASVKESLQMLWLGGGYKLDPETQTMVPDYTGGMPWENPNTAHIFHNWPLAEFGTDGTVTGKYDLGGEVYGDKVGDSTIQKMPDDEALEDAYAKYKYNQGALSPQEWYFATAGGTRAEDKTKIPAELTAADTTDLGTGTTTPTSSAEGSIGPDGTITPKTGSVADQYQQFDTFLATTAGYASPEARASAAEGFKMMANASQNMPESGQARLSVGQGSVFDAAMRRLEAKGLLTDSVVRTDSTSGPKTYYGTKEFLNYAIYVKMLNDGIPQAEARKALATLVGEGPASIALRNDDLPDKPVNKTVSTLVSLGAGTYK